MVLVTVAQHRKVAFLDAVSVGRIADIGHAGRAAEGQRCGQLRAGERALRLCAFPDRRAARIGVLRHDHIGRDVIAVVGGEDSRHDVRIRENADVLAALHEQVVWQRRHLRIVHRRGNRVGRNPCRRGRRVVLTHVQGEDVLGQRQFDGRVVALAVVDLADAHHYVGHAVLWPGDLHHIAGHDRPGRSVHRGTAGHQRGRSDSQIALSEAHGQIGIADALEGFGLRDDFLNRHVAQVLSGHAFLFFAVRIGPRHGQFVDRLGPQLALEAAEFGVVWRDLEEVVDLVVVADQLDLDQPVSRVHEDHGLDVFQHAGDEVLAGLLLDPENRDADSLIEDHLRRSIEDRRVDAQWRDTEPPIGVGQHLVDYVDRVRIVTHHRIERVKDFRRSRRLDPDRRDVGLVGSPVKALRARKVDTGKKRIERTADDAANYSTPIGRRSCAAVVACEEQRTDATVRRAGRLGAVHLVRQVLWNRLRRAPIEVGDETFDTTLLLDAAEQIGLLHVDPGRLGDLARPDFFLVDEDRLDGIHRPGGKAVPQAHVILDDLYLRLLTPHDVPSPSQQLWWPGRLRSPAGYRQRCRS